MVSATRDIYQMIVVAYLYHRWHFITDATEHTRAKVCIGFSIAECVQRRIKGRLQRRRHCSRRHSSSRQQARNVCRLEKPTMLQVAARPSPCIIEVVYRVAGYCCATPRLYQQSFRGTLVIAVPRFYRLSPLKLSPTAFTIPKFEAVQQSDCYAAPLACGATERHSNSSRGRYDIYSAGIRRHTRNVAPPSFVIEIEGCRCRQPAMSRAASRYASARRFETNEYVTTCII